MYLKYYEMLKQILKINILFTYCYAYLGIFPHLFKHLLHGMHDNKYEG